MEQTKGPVVEYKRSSRAMEALRRVPGGAALAGPVEEPKPAQVQHPAAVAQKAAEAAEAAAATQPQQTEPKQVTPPTTVEVETKAELDLDLKDSSEPTKEPIAADLVPDKVEDEIDELVDSKASVGENFKRFRTKLKHVNKQYKETAAEAEALKKKIADYENGLATPSVLQEMQNRVAELERYERIYAVKNTPAYKKTIVEPLQSEQEKLNKLAGDYKIDPAVLTAAYHAGSTAETNRMLASAFNGDDVGALEVKSIFKTMKTIEEQAKAFEAEPTKVIAELQEQSSRIEQEERQRANEIIANQARDAWTDALSEIRGTNKFPELVYKEGDTEHNEKVVRPILQRAGQEYGKLVKHLAMNGLRALPKETAVMLSKMTQLAHQSSVLAVQREQLAARVAELEGLLKERGSVSRPSLNGLATPGAGTTTQPRRGGLESTARAVLNRVINSK